MHRPGWIAIIERITAMWKGCQHGLHAIQIQGGIPQVPIEVHATDPLCLGCDADAVRSQNCAHRMSAMPALVVRRRGAVPGVEPVVIVALVEAAILFAERGMIPI